MKILRVEKLKTQSTETLKNIFIDYVKVNGSPKIIVLEKDDFDWYYHILKPAEIISFMGITVTTKKETKQKLSFIKKIKDIIK